MELEQAELQAEKQREPISFDAGINLKMLIGYFLAHWYWFVIALVLSFMVAYIYLRYQVPIYSASSTVLILGDKRGNTLSELDAFSDVELLSKPSSMDNEIEIFKSRSLMKKVVNDLNLQITYTAKGKIINNEIYKKSPIRVFLVNNEKRDHVSGSLQISVLNEKEFTIKSKVSANAKTHRFGDTIITSIGPAVVSLFNNNVKEYRNTPILVSKSSWLSAVKRYQAALTVKPVNKTASILALTVTDPSKEKAEDIIDNLVYQHNQDAQEARNQISKNTANIISERLNFITGELASVESSEQSFKQSQGLVDIQGQAKMALESERTNKQRIYELTTQMKAADYIFNFIQRSSNTEAIPTNLGINEGTTSGMINNYNQIVIERNRQLQNATEINPVIESLDLQLDNLKQSIIGSLSTYRTTLQIQMNSLSVQAGAFSSKIYQAPSFERQFKSIDRQQQIKEALYLYLLQKREETNIAMAVAVDNTKTIDEALSAGGPVSPDKKGIYSMALALGLLIPSFLLYLKNMLDTKVHGYKDLEKLNIPFIGDIPFTQHDNHLVVSKSVSTDVAESFRMVRTNMDFMLSNATGSGGRLIIITSTLSSEGKSFISLNLASTIALTGKKVILVGLDLRAPKLLQYLGLPDHIGITNYISNPQLDLRDIIIRSPLKENIDILSSGDIPPNPSELLMHERVHTLFSSLKEKYDYVIVDTAPVGMVTDTLLINKYADASIYVVRANYLDRRMIGIPHALHAEKRLTNMSFLLNGSDLRKGYGYGYGYGYGGYGYGYGYGHSYGTYGKEKPKRGLRSWFKRNKK